ncbi:hypothetical protein LWI29_001054 [Acer saccharum]|uniref:gibberellin 3beta-dioxygenase n=1 Tax=Acer saccharum TaxID=4024 RepID=A0AA39RB56_ACESA|nr:hypothetical protein LWI29_001054 [Acer saccharum]KAK1550239.1 hypothetical protein Q3G72_015981 [Acer saccharum]
MNNNNSISASFKTNPTINLDHIIPLDFKTVLKLPKSHSWSTTTTSTHVEVDEGVPVVDLADPEALTLIRGACEKWGMFQVTNHGVPIKLLKQIEFQSKKLFGLPTNQKLLAVRSPEECTGYGLPRISTFFSKLFWSEGFSIMGSPLHHARQLWPNHHFDFCNVMVEYQKELMGLTERILGLMFTSLDLTQEDVKCFSESKNGSKHPQALLQLNSYPICPDPTRAMGLAPHTDSSLLTLLYQTNISGLQVFRENVGWVLVNPISGAFVVNVGDLMHIICNGRFKTALHRALVNQTHHRISVAYFYGPPKDVNISPSIKLVDRDHPILYRPVTWKEFLDSKATHFNKALDFIRFDV